MEQLSRKHDLSRVFNDLLTMAVCSFHSINIQTNLKETDKENEAIYMQTIKPYSNEELQLFAELFGEIQLNVLDAPYSDLLGDYFTNNITRGQNGQFFTPESICELMAKLNGEKDAIEDKTVHDPACGSGRTLLSFAKDNPNNYFFGADVSETCAKMSAVNFFINGLKGEVVQMNTLSMEFYRAWHINMDGLGIRPIEKEQSRIWSSPPKTKSGDQNSQLSLF